MTVTKISTEMNNEIVLLRQCVRRARICVINKLVREAKRLRASRGNEKLSEKNKNKAEKYLREVSELKRAKDDEISKFGIIHLEDLVRMLQNSQTDDRTRAIVKVVRYKCLNEKLLEFVKKFPDCKEYVSLNKKEHSQKKRKKNSMSEHNQKNANRSPNDQNDNDDDDARNTRLSISDATDEETPPRKLKRNKEDVETAGESVKSNAKRSGLITKIVSKEATVKRFTDILQESDTPGIDDRPEENKEQRSSPIPVELTRSDDFFSNSDKVVSKKVVVKRFMDVLQESDTPGIDDRLEENDKEQRSSPMPVALTRPDDFFLNSDKVVAVHQNAATHSEDSNITSRDVDRKTFTTFPRRNIRQEFPRSGRPQENRRQRRQAERNKGVSYRRSNTQETSAMFNEKKKRFTEVKEVSGSMHESLKKDHTKSTVNESLHPSWAARKKQQDAMKQGFQGKKIRFDEN